MSSIRGEYFREFCGDRLFSFMRWQKIVSRDGIGYLLRPGRPSSPAISVASAFGMRISKTSVTLV